MEGAGHGRGARYGGEGLDEVFDLRPSKQGAAPRRKPQKSKLPRAKGQPLINTAMGELDREKKEKQRRLDVEAAQKRSQEEADRRKNRDAIKMLLARRAARLSHIRVDMSKEFSATGPYSVEEDTALGISLLAGEGILGRFQELRSAFFNQAEILSSGEGGTAQVISIKSCLTLFYFKPHSVLF